MEIMRLSGYQTFSTFTASHPFKKCIHSLIQIEIRLYCAERLYVRVPRNKQYDQFIKDIVVVN